MYLGVYEVYEGIWMYMEVYGKICRYMEVYQDIWNYMDVYGDAPGAAAAADELMPSELYQQGSIQIES